MTGVLPQFTLERPATLAEAVTLLSTRPRARLVAGGTDLVVNMRRGLVEAETLIDIAGLAELAAVHEAVDGITIGAAVTLDVLAGHATLLRDFPAVAQAAAAVAGPSHRRAATLGGNLCLDTRCLYYNQSQWWRQSNDYCLKYRGDTCHVAPKGKRCRAAYCGDIAPALMVHHAEITVAGPSGPRRIAVGDFYHEDGADFLALEPGEILVSVFLPRGRVASGYGKIRVRGAIDFPLAGVAVAVRDAPGGRSVSLAFTGTNSCPVLAGEPLLLAKGDDLETFLGALSKTAQKTVSPQRTTTTQPHYRRLAVAALACRLARQLI